MIRIVDYVAGNIQSFVTIFKRLGLSAERAHSPAQNDDFLSHCVDTPFYSITIYSLCSQTKYF